MTDFLDNILIQCASVSPFTYPAKYLLAYDFISFAQCVCRSVPHLYSHGSVSFALRKSWLMQTTLSENNELGTNKMRPLELGLERVWMQNSKGQETPQMVI
jgi:hypothetical protein